MTRDPFPSLAELLDHADRFVWLRAFRDYASRPAALAYLYGGELWARRRDTVNAMLLDSDDVLQLRPLGEVRDLTTQSSLP